MDTEEAGKMVESVAEKLRPVLRGVPPGIAVGALVMWVVHIITHCALDPLSKVEEIVASMRDRVDEG